ncbi:MAG: DAK2 domain-containing protein [Anaerolineae bacterium]|nr:DAK2 domain-containing protein [Anaerolineae bacterium]
MPEKPIKDSKSTSSILKHETGLPILSCDGQGLKRLLAAGLAWLERHSEAINALNVFPVPDGDTGTNMLLTMQSAYEEIAHSPQDTVGEIAQAASYGALMGARGNSGVILSQILRGFARSLEKKQTFNAAEFAAALQEASATAYKGVIKPVEGTILTVIREVANAAVGAAGDSDDLRYVLEIITHHAREAVAHTPALLPVLREAGVVDAGGQGLFIILEGMNRYIQGESMAEDVTLSRAVDLHISAPEEGYGYDVQFVITGQNLDVDEIRTNIARMGESTLVVGDTNTVKVHVHTPEPGNPLNYAARLGSLSRVIVENLQEQYQEFILGRVQPAAMEKPYSGIAIVAVASGAGLMRVMESLGASAVVPGGQSMNPSTEELLRAIENTGAEEVILLPNNSNVIMAAQQAQALSSKKVKVVPTKTIPQGIGALLAFNYQADLETNASSMERAAEEIQTGEITVASRDVQINGLDIKEGQIIGLVNGDLTTTAPTLEEATRQVLQQMHAEECEILTIYYGESITAEEAEALATMLRAQYPDLEIEVVDGGQPHYPYILSIE